MRRLLSRLAERAEGAAAMVAPLILFAALTGVFTLVAEVWL